ncbi:MAG: DedA family protein [Bdellovibrionales bacterium]|nr:DedA family protein [Bdellovibrionales bacterium]
MPEDITLIAAGMLAALKSISYTGALIAGFVGVLSGDCMLFWLGRKYGNHVFELPLFRTVFTEKRIALAREKVLNNSKMICFTARFLPGLRAPTYLTAGVMGVSPLTFLLLDGFAALISVPIWVHLGWVLGDNLDHALAVALKTQKYILLAAAVLLLFFIFYKLRAKRLAKTETDQSPQV